MRGGRNVVALLGGLGNQLFQVAFGLWLEACTGRESWYDVSFKRDLALDVLELPIEGEELSRRLLRRTRWWPTPDGRAPVVGRALRRATRPGRMLRDYTGPGPEGVPLDQPAWWFGYWQRSRYAETLLPRLTVPFGERRPGFGVGVHVRRRDMLDTASAVPSSWYRGALQRLLGELDDAAAADSIRVWSDDPSWCRGSLDLGTPFTVEHDGPAVEHLAGLSRCAGIVISRSTFSWWAARIATQRGARVVYPAPWFDDKELDQIVTHPSWMPLDIDTHGLLPA